MKDASSFDVDEAGLDVSYEAMREAYYRIFARMGLGVDDPWPGLSASVGDVLLRVHRSYLGPLREECATGRVRALAHITGGGIPGNLERLLPDDLDAVAFYDKPITKFARILQTYMCVAPRGLKSFMMACPLWIRQKLWIPLEIEKALEADPE